MSKARLVIAAVVLENRTVAEVAATYGVSRSWVYELLTRYRSEGETAFEPRSRRPKTSPNATPPDVVDLILRLRAQLTIAGLDAGAEAPMPQGRPVFRLMMPYGDDKRTADRS